jgi:Fur family iron response transcriptional regulator
MSTRSGNPAGTIGRRRAEEVRAAQWLASGGLRPTRQRIALAKLLVGDGQNRHVTAESLFESALAVGDRVALATVYNTLRSFTEAGLMTEITVDGTRSYFDTDVSDHAHFFWEDEGRLSDAPHGSVVFERLPEPPEGAGIARVDVVIRLRRG